MKALSIVGCVVASGFLALADPGNEIKVDGGLIAGTSFTYSPPSSTFSAGFSIDR